jgi:preprotein translocase subunit SecD
LLADDRAAKGFEYFLLSREQTPPAVTGAHLTRAMAVTDDPTSTPSIQFEFDAPGAAIFQALTAANVPSPSRGGPFHRRLAILLDGAIITAPRLNQPIGRNGQITGNFTPADAEHLARILRSGPLPLPLKPLPVSETTIEPMP